MSRIRVAELFAGVGGFRLGLEGVPSKEWETDTLKFEDTGFRVIWSNQWEPGSTRQWASRVYTKRFGKEGHEGVDLHEFTKTIEKTHQIPEIDLLVGGFPCQDYSVARTKSGELGIEGEKGKLWEPIWRIISRSHANQTQYRPKVVLLENVPRLLNSPARARGLNFSLILRRLLGMGYEVEWRIINADDYGFPQQRSRIFIMAYRTKGWSAGQTKLNGPGHFGLEGRGAKRINPMLRWVFGDYSGSTREDWEVGPFAHAFPADFEVVKEKSEIPKIDDFSHIKSPFGSAGYAWKGKFRRKGEVKYRTAKLFRSWKVIPIKEKPVTISDIMIQIGQENYDVSYEVDESKLHTWQYEKGSKREFRIRKIDLEKYPELAEIYKICKKSKSQRVWDEYRPKFEEILGTDGSYNYDEGTIAFPDSIGKPSRTVVTAEIGRSASRMRHIIRHDEGTYRTLFPIETERLNMFPDNWTKIESIPNSKRGFMMGNALVIGIIKRLSQPLKKLILKKSSNLE